MTNVVLIVIDTLRADHMGVYGYGRDTTPRMQELADGGVCFRECFSHANATHPSFTTLFTGLHPLNHGIVGHFGTRTLDSRVPVLAQAMRAGGYTTAAVDNMNRWFKRGFDVYLPFRFDHTATTPMYTGEQVNALALPLLTRLAQVDRPFFLFVHYWDPHSPYLPPPSFADRYCPSADSSSTSSDDNNEGIEGSLDAAYRFWPLERYLRRWMGHAPRLASVVANYDAEIAYVDSCVGHLVDHLKSLGMRDDTAVIVTADHGESLGEHGIYFDHHGLYEPQLHVPLLINCPSALPVGVQVNGLTQHIDVTPTILDLVNLTQSISCEGVTLRDRIAGHAAPTTETLVAVESTRQSKYALRNSGWKLIHSRQSDMYGNPTVELYDLRTDPGENLNVADEYPDVVTELGAELNVFIAQELESGGHQVDPMETEGITLEPMFARHSGRHLRKRIVGLLKERGLLPQERERYTPEEEALVMERLSDLGYL